MKLLLSLLFALASWIVFADKVAFRKVPYAGKYSNKKTVIPKYVSRGKNEFRGLWVATVENIDFPRTQSASAFKAAYSRLLANAKKAGFNAVIFQVRPSSDAFYRSDINPWSRNLTGIEGTGISGFDPLAYMVKATHLEGMQFHAWLNPYRVCGNTKVAPAQYLTTLSKMNFARQNPHFVLAPPSERAGYRTLLLDPGIPQVRSHILATVSEIVSKYDVDAIHFDDYFYPYGGVDNLDLMTYKKYNPLKLSLHDWRRNNVNLVIKSVKSMLDAHTKKSGRKVQFGVSPFGIWGNASKIAGGSLTGGKESYFINYADTRKWVQRRWVDYIVPQLYWHFGHETAAYACLVDWWCATGKGTGVRLYIGLAPYRLGAAEWSSRELADQLRYNSNKSEVSGNVMFSYSKVFFPSKKALPGVRQALYLWK